MNVYEDTNYYNTHTHVGRTCVREKSQQAHLDRENRSVESVRETHVSIRLPAGGLCIFLNDSVTSFNVHKALEMR